jgi:hypothetical protein
MHQQQDVLGALLLAVVVQVVQVLVVTVQRAEDQVELMAEPLH